MAQIKSHQLRLPGQCDCQVTCKALNVLLLHGLTFACLCSGRDSLFSINPTPPSKLGRQPLSTLNLARVCPSFTDRCCASARRGHFQDPRQERHQAGQMSWLIKRQSTCLPSVEEREEEPDHSPVAESVSFDPILMLTFSSICLNTLRSRMIS